MIYSSNIYFATVVISAKSTSDAYGSPTLGAGGGAFPPDPNSPQSTINTVEREIREAGGEATAIPANVRNHSSVQHLVQETVNVSAKEEEEKGWSILLDNLYISFPLLNEAM